MDWCSWLILVVAGSIYAVYKFLTWNYDYWTERGVPALKPSLPFGNVADIIFQRKIIGQVYKEIYDKFEGEPFCGFYKIRNPMLLVRDPELVKTVIIKEFHNFDENDFHMDPKADPIIAMNPFSVTGQRWKDVRAVLAPSQTPSKLKTVVPCTVAVSKTMIAYLEENLGKELETMEILGHFVTDVTAAWGLGLQTNSFKNPESDFRVKSTNMFGGDFKSNAAIVLGFYAPAIGKFLGWSTIRDQFSSYFTKVVVDVLNERQSSSERRQDLIDLLLSSARDSVAKNKRVIDFEEVTGHTLTFFSEGYLTSSFTLTFVLHELSLHPKIQEKAREEVVQVIGSLDELDYDKVQKLTYLNQVIDETLRLHPTVPNMARVCTGKTELVADGKKVVLEPGTPVAISILGLHHDPKYYPNPLVFDPDRFSDENRASRDKTLYLGFSDGPRACVGIRFAMTNMKICLAALLLNFKILPTSRSHEFTVDPSSAFVMTPKNGFIKFSKL